MKRKARLYMRFSPRPNAQACESIERQRADLRAYCEREGIEIVKEYWDTARSGDDETRPYMWDAINDLKRGEILLVRSWDRLSRNTRDAMALIVSCIESKGCKCYSITEGADILDGPIGELIRTILIAIAQFQRQMIAARTKAAMLRHQQSGRLMSKVPPFGMRYGKPQEIVIPPKRPGDKPMTKEIKTLEPDPEEQAIIERIVTLFESGTPMRQIGPALEEDNIWCRGREWTFSTIRKILVRAGKVAPLKKRPKAPLVPMLRETA